MIISAELKLSLNKNEKHKTITTKKNILIKVKDFAKPLQLIYYLIELEALKLMLIQLTLLSQLPHI